MSVHHQRAEDAAELKRWDLVLAEAKLAIADEPNRGSGYALLAQALNAKQQNKAALLAVDDGLKVAPQNEWLHRLRAAICNEQGALDAALTAVTEALRIDPNNASGHGLAARIRNNRREPSEARAAIKRALELDGDAAWLHRTAGDIELPIKPHQAVAHYREALRINPRDAYAMNNLGAALERIGQSEEAALAYRSAVLIDPTLSVAKRNTHASVKKLVMPTRVVVGGLGAGAVGLKFLFAGSMCARTVHSGVSSSSGDSGNAGWILLGLLLALVVGAFVFGFVRRYAQHRRQERRVRDTYPELWAMYEQLEADRKRNRL